MLKYRSTRLMLFGLVLLILPFIGIPLARVQAAAGDLDTTFGSGGIVNVGFQITHIAPTPGGKILVLGPGHLARLNADGSFDLTFGGTGVITPFVSSSLVLQPDGKVVLGGAAPSDGADDFALTRINQDGTVDTGFGNNGRVVTVIRRIRDRSDLPSLGSQITALGLLSSGSIAAVGIGHVDDSAAVGFVIPVIDTGFVWVTYNSDGSVAAINGPPSLTFSEGLAVVVWQDNPIFGGFLIPRKLCNPPEGCFFQPEYDAIDSRTLTGGPSVDFPGASDSDIDVVLQSDGKFISLVVTSTGRFIARYNTDHTLDTSFGSSGIENADDAAALALQANGKLIAVGSAIKRYDGSGMLDGSFGSNGVVTSPIGLLDDVAVDSADKILITGGTQIARLLGDMATPQQSIQQLVDSVDGLVSKGALNQGQGNALKAKLQAALNQLSRGNHVAAANQVQAFINQVSAFMRSGLLPAAQAQPLIELADSIKEQLQS